MTTGSTTPTIPPSPAPLPLTAWRAASSRRKSSTPIRAIYGRSGCTTPLSFNMGAVQDLAGSSSEGRPTPRLERIAILAGGVCTPIGQDVDAFWSALLTGADGISRIERFPVDDLRVCNGGEIKKLTRAIERSRARLAEEVVGGGVEQSAGPASGHARPLDRTGELLDLTRAIEWSR